MKFKKSIALIIVIVMILGSLSGIVSAATSVSDIDGHWAQTEIQALLDLGAVSGYPDGTFLPNKAVNRAEFCKIVTNALAAEGFITLDAATGTKFSDVAATDWYATYVETAANKGYVNGTSPTTFDPLAPITREQMAKIMSLVYAGLNSKTIEDLVAQFDPNNYNLPDLGTVSSWATNYVKAALVAQIMNGKPEGFVPQGQPTRAETCVVVYRIVTNVVVNTPTPTPGPIRIHGTKLTVQSASLANPAGDNTTIDLQGTPELLFDGIASDMKGAFTCKQDKPEYVLDLGSVQDVQSFAITGYSTSYQSVFFRLLISPDNQSWTEVGKDVACQIGKPIIDDPSIFVAENFDADGHLISGSQPTKFDVSTTDSIITFGNYGSHTVTDPASGDQYDVDCFASPTFDRTLTGINWADYGFVSDKNDHAFNYFMDDVQQARYIKIIGYGNSMTQWYMYSSFVEAAVFGPGTSEDKPQ